MCPITATMAGSAGAALAANIAIASAATAIVTTAYTSVQQAKIAQANLDAQAQAQIKNMELTRQQMVLSQEQNQETLRLQNQQAADAYNLQVLQQNNQIANAARQREEATRKEQQFILKKNEVERNSYFASVEEARAQNRLSNEAANRTYITAQTKLDEKRKQVRFEQQAILAKAIGNRGNILATGRAGQSIGLLAKDVERQKGQSLAQTYATLDSARDAATIEMESGFLKSKSEANLAFSKVDLFPSQPYLPKLPGKPDYVRPNYIQGIGLSIDSSLTS